MGKDALPKDGVVKDAAAQAKALQDVARFLRGETPWNVVDEMVLPVQGEKGNVEFFLHAR